MANEKLLIGYVTSDALPSITAADAQKMTHINVAFGHVREARVTVTATRNLDTLCRLREYHPKLGILLSLGGWGSGGFSEAAATDEGRKLMARTALDILREFELEGIDLDWEYPCYSVAGIASHPADKRNFTLLLKELRRALDEEGQRDGKHYLLTIATGADQYYLDGTEMDQVEKYLDWVQLMTYDMRGGFNAFTGHHTNLYTPTGDLFRISVDASVNMFVKAGVPKEKIVIGAAFYSRMWQNVPNSNNGLHQMTAGAGGSGPMYTELAAEYINKNGFTRYFDDEAQAPYLFDGQTFITYDDEESLRAKCLYVKEHGLKGIMFWEYNCDQTGTLLDVLYRSMA
ncbi:MAG: glycoside hydrolase family 18 protein [Limnochordia bacterium]|jgi:chitinase|nr:glycoside hydrolase family 18 protein [Limnochordia bacterium]